ncbi:hypothetical protein HNQ36_003153 [Afipia massiliensis]|uniref:Uncharacterized protein n=1 Tax=Afipia massiliensis TaxID=211460 RepID=A0A840N2M5_9BRAD|nr:hypothetical protein [Afipia massiliensis]MBB5053162.1 hypothetical protein [Afipia massiliensis]
MPGGGRSTFCGIQACSFQIYARRGELLTPAGEFLGVESITVDGEQIPTIRTGASRRRCGETGASFAGCRASVADDVSFDMRNRQAVG